MTKRKHATSNMQLIKAGCNKNNIYGVKEVIQIATTAKVEAGERIEIGRRQV
jgi:hypothetical protein